MASNHLAGVSLQDMQAYLLHHLKIAGVEQNLFPDPAVTAIQQGSGGLLRRANHLARGAIIAAVEEQNQVVSPEYVRIVATKLIRSNKPLRRHEWNWCCSGVMMPRSTWPS
ncbi:hypothetical protein DFAR_2770045 [Desulfarculales bacterium]